MVPIFTTHKVIFCFYYFLFPNNQQLCLHNNNKEIVNKEYDDNTHLFLSNLLFVVSLHIPNTGFMSDPNDVIVLHQFEFFDNNHIELNRLSNLPFFPYI